jgi:adenosine kinase
VLDKNGFRNWTILENSYAEVASLSPVYVAGGAAQNAARCAQYILPENSTVYLGAVGDDDLANQLREANKKAGLKELYQVVKEFPTGACACLITGHHRSVFFFIIILMVYHGLL